MHIQWEHFHPYDYKTADVQHLLSSQIYQGTHNREELD